MQRLKCPQLAVEPLQPRISEVLSLPFTAKKKIPDYSLANSRRAQQPLAHRRHWSDTRHLPAFMREFVPGAEDLPSRVTAKARKPLYPQPHTLHKQLRVIPRPLHLAPLPALNETPEHSARLYQPYTIEISPKARITVYSCQPLNEEPSAPVRKRLHRGQQPRAQRLPERKLTTQQKPRTFTKFTTTATTFGEMLERARIIAEETVKLTA